MRIALIAPTVGEGFGQERVLRDSARLLQEAGHSVFFVCQSWVPSSEKFPVYVIEDLHRVHHLSPPWVVRSLVKRSLAILDQIRPDVIHLAELFDARLVRAWARRAPTVLTSHTVSTTCPASHRMLSGQGECEQRSGWSCLWHHHRKGYGCLGEFKNDLHRLHVVRNYLFKQKAMRELDGVFAISHYVKRMLVLDGMPEEKVSVVYNPVAAPTLEVGSGLASADGGGEPLIVCAARLVPLKGVDHLLSALKRIDRLSWQLWVCGDGPQRRVLEKMAHGMGLGSRVRFLGRVPFSEMQQIFLKARLVVQPNLGPEAFGLSVVEAQAAGVPVVSYRVPAMDEVVDEGGSGFLVEAFDVRALSERIAFVLEDSQRWEELSQRARVWAGRFSPERYLEQTLGGYRVLTRRGRVWSAERVEV